MRKVVVVYERVTHHADEDGRHEEEFGDLVLYDGIQHIFHGEGGEHVDRHV